LGAAPQDVGLARYIMHTHVATASVPMGTFAYAAPGALAQMGSGLLPMFCAQLHAALVVCGVVARCSMRGT